MAFALSGSPAMAAACMARCLGTPESASATSGPQHGTYDRAEARHEGHGAATRPDTVSSHAHHGPTASVQPAASQAVSAQTSPHAHLVERCDSCCVEGPAGFAAGPGVEQPAARPCTVAPTAAVAVFRLRAIAHVLVPPRPPVPPLPPTRAPLALRI